MYNVLQKLRKSEELTSWARRSTNEAWSRFSGRSTTSSTPPRPTPTDGLPICRTRKILRRLVALSAERAEEEKRGLIRWLRPEFQNPTGQSAGQGTLGIADKPTASKAKKSEKLPWPKTLAEQAQVSPLRPRRRAAGGHRRGVVQAIQVGEGGKGRRTSGDVGGTGAG
jgi:hypothetical protein